MNDLKAAYGELGRTFRAMEQAEEKINEHKNTRPDSVAFLQGHEWDREYNRLQLEWDEARRVFKEAYDKWSREYERVQMQLDATQNELRKRLNGL